jgi:hypothetical protein
MFFTMDHLPKYTVESIVLTPHPGELATDIDLIFCVYVPTIYRNRTVHKLNNPSRSSDHTDKLLCISRCNMKSVSRQSLKFH